MYVFWSAVDWPLLCCKFAWANCCADSLSAVNSCLYFVYLNCADGCAIVLSNLHPALREFVRLCFNSNIYYVVHGFLLFNFEFVNTIIWVILSCVVFWLAN